MRRIVLSSLTLGLLIIGAGCSQDFAKNAAQEQPDQGDGDSPSQGESDANGDGDGNGRPRSDGGMFVGDGDGAAPQPGDGDGDGDQPNAPSARVVGYLPAWRGVGEWAARIGTLGVTHVNLAFANPDDTLAPALQGSEDELHAFVSAAHAANIQVLVSIGGGGGSGKVREAFRAGTVDDYVAKLAAYLEEHELDGLDVDVEGDSATTPEYATFVAKVSEAVHGQHRLLSAALATWFVDDVPDEALRAFDFINVMSYDHCGPWTDACEQATYEAAVADLDYFAEKRGIDKSKVVLGVPFYAYCWGNCESGDYSYAELLAHFPDAANKDWIDQDGMQISYNGEATMRRKLELAKRYGGMMIWELGQDAVGDKSLLRIITGK
jgi:GH18 family chitinase